MFYPMQMFIEYCDGGALDSIIVDLEKGLTEKQVRQLYQHYHNNDSDHNDDDDDDYNDQDGANSVDDDDNDDYE